MAKRDAAEPRDPVLPERQVQLLNGEWAIVRPWSLRQGHLLSERVIDLVDRILEDRRTRLEEAKASGDAAPAPPAFARQLLALGFTEIMAIVRETIGYTPEAMDALTYEDGLTLTEAVLEVCLIRGEDGGVLGKMVRLVDRAGVLVVQMASRLPNRATLPTSSTSSLGKGTTARTSSSGARR